jgi:hypothetical protein
LTIICALSDKETGEVWLGCNDGMTIGETRLPSVMSKWLRFGDWALGVSGIGLAHNVLQMNAGKFPRRAQSPLDIILHIKTAFAEFDLGAKEEGDVALSYDVSCLLAHAGGRLWDMDFRLATDEVPAGTLWARGSGMDFALGADFALRQSGLAARDRIQNAVEAALFYDTGCPGSALVEVLPAPG